MSKLIRLYPSPWRERYEAELADLLARRPASIRGAVDLVRGAADAHLHPSLLVAGLGSGPWTHRVPGLLAVAAGLLVAVTALALAAGLGAGTWFGGDLIGLALVLMLISLPGEYLAPYGRRIGAAICCIVPGIAVASATGWWQPAVVVALGAEMLALGGILAMVGVRAGVGSRERWLLLVLSIGIPLAAYGAILLLRASIGLGLVPDGSPVVVLAVLPYGLAWIVVGLRLTVRGSPTFLDPSSDLPRASEVQPA